MTRSFLLCITLSVLTAACSKASPTTPTPPAATRIIRVGGNLNFGDVPFFAVSADGSLTISNDGNDVLQINTVTYQRTAPNVLVAGNISQAWCFEVIRNLSPANFALAPGQTLSVGFRFSPVIDPARGIFPRDANSRFDCSGTFTVVGTQTSGTSTIGLTAVAIP